MSWPTDYAPFSDNRTPLLVGLNATTGDGAVPVAVDPVTGAVLISGGGSGGTSSDFSAAFPVAGTAVGASDGTDMQPLSVDGSGNLKVVVESGGSGGTQYTDGDTPPTYPIGTAPIFDNSGTWAVAASANGLPVNIVGGLSDPLQVSLTTNPLVTTPLVGQSTVAITGTAVQLNGGTSQALTNGIIITAASGNSGPISVGSSGVNHTQDGTGNGYLLAASASISFAVTDTNDVYINGSAGDYVSWAGS
jgi:hypothetical protein